MPRPPALPLRSLADVFGPIDIYLFDQLLRGRITPDMTVLDAGCGAGRNVKYLLGAGIEVMGVDPDPEAIARVRALAAKLAPSLPPENFRAEHVEAMSFPDACADVVISNAVLHFARDDAHFDAMLDGMWRVLRPGGFLFTRLASTIGQKKGLEHLEGRRYRQPDGSERYLVDERLLAKMLTRLEGELADPLKTTVVHQQRSMTTWVVRKLD